MQSGSGIPQKPTTPVGFEPEAQGGEYSWEWAQLRKLHRRLLMIAAAGIADAGFIASPIANSWRPIGLLLFLAWIIVLIMLFSTLFKIGSWACPRCGKPFQRVQRTFSNWSNPFTGKCLHCGLPKWAETDPDPKLKRELDPFRTDSIFKLGDVKKD